ncbi:MAG: phasin family protein [Alphaproteobacteria bacterium]|nr:phasin family protein [Alphaproteobacteria bacterium]
MNTTANETMDQVNQATQNFAQACQEASSIAREHVDATVKSAALAWEGCTEINQNLNGLVQESLSRALSAGKTMMGARTLREVMDLQADFMRECFDSWVAGTGKISEISARVTKDAMEPIANQANNAISKFAQKARSAA